MPKYLFQAQVASHRTPVFAAHFDDVDAANAFTRRIRDELMKSCPGARTSFKRISNTRGRRLSNKMRTFHKPRRMTAHSILKMPGVPVPWRHRKQKRRSHRQR